MLKRHAVRPEMHNDGLEYRFYLIDTVEALDSAASVEISECLFNLRAALDHLVYQLHVRRFRGHPPPDAERDAQFPIVSTRRTADTLMWKEIRRLSQRQRAAIKHLQPFFGRNDQLKETRARLHALAILNNIDKHRRLHVTNRLAAPVSKADDFPADCGFRQQVFFCPLVAGAYVERWSFTKPPTQMNVHNDIWSQVTIDEPAINLRFYVYELLSWLVGDVDQILRTFSRRFWGKHRTDWL
jgi:hypothetical protein